MKILSFARQLREFLLPMVEYILLFLVVIFFLLLAIYLIAIFIHARQKKYLVGKTSEWQNMLETLLSAGASTGDLHIPRRDRKYFREILIREFATGSSYTKNRIIQIYEQLGFYDDDIRALNSRAWWKKAQSIERLNDLGMEDAEDEVFRLLADKRIGVRFSALKMLASIRSQKLFEALPKVFDDSTRWAYRYLVNELFSARIPVENLIPLATSKNRDCRKAAAILMGQKGSEEAILPLQNLTNDNVKDVRREAVRSLGRIGLTEAVPILSEKRADKNSQVRAAVADALGQLRDPAVLVSLEELVSDPDFDVRFQAFFALHRLGKEGKNIIEKYKDKYPEITKEFLSWN